MKKLIYLVLTLILSGCSDSSVFVPQLKPVEQEALSGITESIDFTYDNQHFELDYSSIFNDIYNTRDPLSYHVYANFLKDGTFTADITFDSTKIVYDDTTQDSFIFESTYSLKIENFYHSYLYGTLIFPDKSTISLYFDHNRLAYYDAVTNEEIILNPLVQNHLETFNIFQYRSIYTIYDNLTATGGNIIGILYDTSPFFLKFPINLFTHKDGNLTPSFIPRLMMDNSLLYFNGDNPVLLQDASPLQKTLSIALVINQEIESLDVDALSEDKIQQWLVMTMEPDFSCLSDYNYSETKQLGSYCFTPSMDPVDDSLIVKDSYYNTSFYDLDRVNHSYTSIFPNQDPFLIQEDLFLPSGILQSTKNQTYSALKIGADFLFPEVHTTPVGLIVEEIGENKYSVYPYSLVLGDFYLVNVDQIFDFHNSPHSLPSDFYSNSQKLKNEFKGFEIEVVPSEHADYYTIISIKSIKK